MILVDSSVWIDYYRGLQTVYTDTLEALIGNSLIVVGDLILAEVLQGISDEGKFIAISKEFDSFDIVTLGGKDVALAAARNYRRLRKLGVTVRGTIDTVIATTCILNDFELLHNDRDFFPFEIHLGMRSVIPHPNQGSGMSLRG